MVRRKLRFFLRLGVFRPAKPEWAGQTCAPELVPTGCECLMGKGAVWEERVGPGPDGEGGRSCLLHSFLSHGAQQGVYVWEAT